MFTIEVFESEIVIPRGTRRVRWQILVNDDWIGVSEHPTARIQHVDSGPGTVWERRIELDVESGTLLERLTSSPATQKADPLAYLERDRPRAKWQKQRSEYRVGPKGELFPTNPERRA